ncbi:hypothetical protein GCM10009757_10110 [Streptomyces cheonanensis]|uniref:Uncharacterized protein n=1 Tax=Streptomyces cheonanensis TaxID=312720 RepID=A0ABP5GH96_9ACTN
MGEGLPACSAPATREALMPHRNAPLTETGRLRLAWCVVEEGLAHAASSRAVPGITDDCEAVGRPFPPVRRGR